jgi:hypothetical protein
VLLFDFHLEVSDADLRSSKLLSVFDLIMPGLLGLLGLHGLQGRLSLSVTLLITVAVLRRATEEAAFIRYFATQSG